MKKTMVSIVSAFLAFSMTAHSSVAAPADSAGDIISTKYVIGDIILSDGSAVKEKDFTEIDNSNAPIAVIAGFKEDGKALGLGLHRSDSPLPWAADSSEGYMTRFEDLVCTQDSGMAYTGDTDGSDNWEIICSQDETGTAESAENYPAFHFVETYAQTYDLSDDYAEGWYMPSIRELCEVYQNREAVNDSLKKIYELDHKAAMDELGTNWYWSSSQAGVEDDHAWFVHYFNGYAGECPKNFTNVHVLTVRGF